MSYCYAGVAVVLAFIVIVALHDARRNHKALTLALYRAQKAFALNHLAVTADELLRFVASRSDKSAALNAIADDIEFGSKQSYVMMIIWLHNHRSDRTVAGKVVSL